LKNSQFRHLYNLTLEGSKISRINP